eukprot:TRINITY_DN63886_c0_g1_i1.p1 TRINITY_DN63886_c0_g1~~TRINITY_DN63886_c0_g1_i1.p1  ORF type:complete len:286 (-),score=57.63 TRINITY_DN63886_c0_g1_i1:83-847(-)
MAGGEDPFADFLSQDNPAPPAPVQHEAQGEVDVGLQLRLLVESNQRQEQLLGKVCNLLASLDEKMGRMVDNQASLQHTLASNPPVMSASGGGGGYGGGGGGPLAGGGGGGRDHPPVDSRRATAPPQQRGNMILPPGKGLTQPMPHAPAAPMAMPGEDPRVAAERERQRIEEDGRRRAEEIARRREEDERRRREEAERQRAEEERRREEERQRKLALEKKTTGLMSNLVSGGGGGLFGDEDAAASRPKRGGLFDD